MAPQAKMQFGDLKAFAIGSPILLSATSFLLVAAFIRFLLNRPKKLDLPVFGTLETKDHRDLLLEGTSRYPDSPFIVEGAPRIVILPMSLHPEVKNLPENKASFMEDVRRMFVAKHTGIGNNGPEVAQVVKIELTRHIASTLDDLQEEVVYGFAKELGECKDWQSIHVYSKMARVIALLSGRVFVGLPLSREEEWLDASINFATLANDTRIAIHSWPEWSRGIVAPFLPEIRKMKRFRKRGGVLLKPILDDQLAKFYEEKPAVEDSETSPGTLIQWLLSHTKENERANPEVLADNQMGLSFAAIHTTTMATTAALYDIAAYPEYIPALRAEIQQVLDEDGYDLDGDGYKKLKKSSMPKLWKLDSFLKESQRMTPPGLVSNSRICTSEVTLSTGHVLPKGTRYGVASWVVQHTPTAATFNPANNPPETKPLNEFDALRFYNLRKIKGNENKYQFVTTSPDSLNFGHGNHACPGRFFAGNEIKVMLIHLLQFWEVRFEGDVAMVGGKEKRPGNFISDMTVMPNPLAKMEFRRRAI